MPANTRDIKRRIRSITNTKQITKAMELVSAAKMRRATKAVQATRPYANLAWESVLNLAERTDRARHPLLHKRWPVKREAVVMISSNRGLCGGFNQQISKQVFEYIAEKRAQDPKLEVEIIVLGKRAGEAALKTGYKIVADFGKADVVTRVSEISPLSRLVIDDFQSRKYDRVMVAYTDYISSLKQVSQLRQILPIEKKIEGLGDVSKQDLETKTEPTGLEFSEYLFEPSPDDVLRVMLPRLVEVQLYQAVLESNASEHAARMIAMRNATENAEEYIDDLVLSFNQARQASITRDLSEISASRAVLAG